MVDGYIEGATVCLDLNANQACDANEPNATSKAGGTYSLDVSGVDADKLKAAHLLTVVPIDAKDSDDKGLTLGKAGKQAFNLLAPAAAFVNSDGSLKSAVISPLTTLVSHEMISGGNTLETSEKYVRSRLDLAGDTDLHQDFVAKDVTDLKSKAQMLAVAMGEVKAQVLEYQGKEQNERDAFLAALTYLQTQAANLQKAYDDAKTADTLKKTLVQLVADELKKENGSAKPAIANLVAEAKKMTSSTAAASVVAVLEQGFYTAEAVFEDCSQASYYCVHRYSQVQGSGGKINLSRDYKLVGSSWQLESNTSSTTWVLVDGKGWVQDSNCPDGTVTYVADSTGGATIKSCNGLTEKVTARMVDASGKTLKALLLYPPEGHEGVTMPSGSVLYWIDLARTQDEYQIYTGSKVMKPQNYTSAFSSLDDYIATYSTTKKNKDNWDGLNFTFDENGTSSGGKVTLWSNSGKTIGSADYERRKISGQEVLIIKATLPDAERNGEWVMFGVKDGFVYNGNFRSASAKKSSYPFFNKTMINAILNAGNKPEVLSN
ncbi:hypothetical protein B9Z51_13945 [Limnohabitans sp. T6-5]|nr:hypothetical protein B9Z51_13945 [Limnohabitans sp. T6-5]